MLRASEIVTGLLSFTDEIIKGTSILDRLNVATINNFVNKLREYLDSA